MNNQFRISVFVFFIFCLVISSCKKDEEIIEPLIDCDKSEFIASIGNFEDQFLTSITSDSVYYHLSFETSQSLRVCKELFSGFTIDSVNWQSTFIFLEGDVQTIPFIGKVVYSTEINPFGHNPLCAIINFEVPKMSKVHLQILSKHSPTDNLVHQFETLSKEHEVPVFGLYQDYENKVVISLIGEDDNTFITDTLLFQTEKIIKINPIIQVLQRDRSRMGSGSFHLVSSLSWFSPTVVYMFDDYGEIRWLVDYTDHHMLGVLFYDVGVEQLKNGNLYFGDLVRDRIYEVDFFGRVVNLWEMPGFEFHHNVREKPNGNFLLTARQNGSTHQNGKPTIDDFILEIERSIGDIIHVWDLKDYLDENRIALGNWPGNNEIDWAHSNSVEYDESDHTIIVSVRHQGVVKLDYEGNVKWILSPHKGWGTNRKGEDCNDFLLEPINFSGVPYGEQVRLGNVKGDGFEWNWYQHAAFLNPRGNLMLFDNGAYSRAVEYEIDEANMTAFQVWSYGKDRGEETFSPIISDVDYFEETNTVLFAPGFNVFNGNGFLGGRIVEVDYNTQDIVFEALVLSPGLTFHRVERMDLY